MKDKLDVRASKPKSMNPFREPGRAKLNDVWQLGRHRLMCGDSSNREHVAQLMGRKRADICFTSPPYGQQRDYCPEVKLRVTNWDSLMNGVFQNLPMTDRGQVLVNLGLIHRKGEWLPYWDNWIEFMRTQGWRRFGWYVWDKRSGLPGDWNGRLAPSFEFVFHFNKVAIKPQKIVPCKHAGIAKNGVGLRAKDGSPVPYSHAGRPVQPNKIPDSTIRLGRHNGRTDHPAVFPVSLPAFGMECWPGRVYEPFNGSGSTLLAAEQLGRECFAMEINPEFVDVALGRWEAMTGERAVRR